MDPLQHLTLAWGPKLIKVWSLLGDSHPQAPATGTHR